MPIKEEPVRIEFQYEQKDAKTSDGTFNVEYFSEKDGEEEKKYLNITPNGVDKPHIFEVDFFVEVVDFLRKKGVVENVEESVENDTPEGPTPKSGLPLPNIQTVSDASGPSQIFAPIVENENPTYVPVAALATPSEPELPTVITASDGTSMSIINRPVIRTRIKENEDPMKAIEESNRQRRSNPQKSIKRAEGTTDEI